MSKLVDGKIMVDQGIIAGCAGGGFENICDAADILRNKSIGDDRFSLNIYPASMPVYMELVKNGVLASAREIRRPTTRSRSVIRLATSRTAKVQKSRKDRSLLSR